MGFWSNLFKNDKEIIKTLEEDMRAHRALSQQYQDEVKKLMFERDEALEDKQRYKNLNMDLLEQLRLLKEKLNQAESNAAAWEARYHNELSEHAKTREMIDRMTLCSNKKSSCSNKKSSKTKKVSKK